MSNAIEYSIIEKNLGVFTNKKGQKINMIEEVSIFQNIKFPDGVWNNIKEFMIEDNIIFHYHYYPIYKTNYDCYLNHKTNHKLLKKFMKDKDDDDYSFDCYFITLFNPMAAYYDELVLIDIDDGYAPVFNTNISTSSGYAAWRCDYTDYEYEDDEENKDNSTLKLRELIKLVNPTLRNKFTKTLLEYKKKEHNYLDRCRLEKL